MKTVLIALLLAVVFVAAEDEKTDDVTKEYQSEFMQGMENGFFLRDQVDAHKEYECPDAAVKEQFATTINSVLGPVKMILSLAGNEVITAFWEVIEHLMTYIIKLSGSVQGY